MNSIREQILFHQLFDNDLNIAPLDNIPCRTCGKVPEIKEYMARTLKGTLILRVDRTSRIDCDASMGDEPSILVTYHRECWIQEVLE